MIVLQKLPDKFYCDCQLRERVIMWSQSNSLPAFQKMIPFFFKHLAKLDNPTDVWFVRDIINNSGNDIIKKDKILTNIALNLSDTFITYVYSELRGISTSLEFIKKLYAIDAEIRCGQLIKNVGANNIKKCTTPEDVSCTYNGKKTGFQVKFKSDEDFTRGLVEDALIGEMYKPSSETLREYSHFSIHRCTSVKEGFLSNSIDYIHSYLNNHLQQKNGSLTKNNFSANIEQFDGMIFLEITGKNKYEGSSLNISFQQNPKHKLGSTKAAFTDQKPNQELWGLLEKKIREIPSKPCLIGWIDLAMSFQYDNYFSNELNRKKIYSFLNEYSIPIVVLIKVKFSAPLFFSNKLAMTYPLIKKLASKNQIF